MNGVETRAEEVGIRDFAMRRSGSAKAKGKPSAIRGPLLSQYHIALYILLVEQNREFRNRHWNFTKWVSFIGIQGGVLTALGNREYIIKQTRFPLATGGSPIIKYLPHNLDVVLRTLEETYADFSPMDAAELASHHGAAGKDLAKEVEQAGIRAQAQRRILDREVKELSKERDDGDTGMANPYDTTAVDKVFRDEKKHLQRGWVGNDGVG